MVAPFAVMDMPPPGGLEHELTSSALAVLWRCWGCTICVLWTQSLGEKNVQYVAHSTYHGGKKNRRHLVLRYIGSQIVFVRFFFQ